MRLFPKRLTAAAVIASLVIGLFVYGGKLNSLSDDAAGVPAASSKASTTSTDSQNTDTSAPGDIDPNADVTDAEQNQVMRVIGDTPDLDEVYIDKTLDGRLVISVTAVLTEEDEKNEQYNAKKIITTFIHKSFSLHPTIAGCMINVLYDNHLVAGAELGSSAEAALTTQTTTGTANPDEVIQFLQELNQQTQDVTKNAWFYSAG